MKRVGDVKCCALARFPARERLRVMSVSRDTMPDVMECWET